MKYICWLNIYKGVLWRVAKRLSYIEEARCLKVNIKGVRGSLLILWTQTEDIWNVQFTSFIINFCYMQRRQLLYLNINTAVSSYVCHPPTLVYWWNVGESKMHFSANLSFIFGTQYFIASLCLAYIHSRPEWTTLIWRLYTVSLWWGPPNFTNLSSVNQVIVYGHCVLSSGNSISHHQDCCVSINWKWQYNC